MRQARSPIFKIIVIDTTLPPPQSGFPPGSRRATVWASEYHLRQILFEIPTTNFPCILFAKALGFSFCGFNDHHFANREIALFFSLSI